MTKGRPAPFRVIGSTTVDELDGWLELRPNIESLKLRRPNGDPVKPTRGYRAMIEIVHENAVVSDPRDSLIEALDSVVTQVEELFPL